MTIRITEEVNFLSGDFHHSSSLKVKAAEYTFSDAVWCDYLKFVQEYDPSMLECA